MLVQDNLKARGDGKRDRSPAVLFLELILLRQLRCRSRRGRDTLRRRGLLQWCGLRAGRACATREDEESNAEKKGQARNHTARARLSFIHTGIRRGGKFGLHPISSFPCDCPVSKDARRVSVTHWL